MCWTTVFTLLTTISAGCTDAVDTVSQSARDLPLAAHTDVLICGGTVGAVAAAIEASETGADVWLIAPRTYLGEDLCATLQLWQTVDTGPSNASSDPPDRTSNARASSAPNGLSEDLVERIFQDQSIATPLRIKQTLESALLEANVHFLLGCFPTDVLFDSSGRPAAVAIANRAGRQVIQAHVLIDATDRGIVARMAGARVSPGTGKIFSARRVVLGGQATSRQEPQRAINVQSKATRNEQPYYLYAIKTSDAFRTFGEIAELEQRVRDRTYREGQLRAGERLSIVWQDRVCCERGRDQWSAEGPIDLLHFRPEGVEGVYLLSGWADIPREVVRTCFQVGQHVLLGRRIGTQAAQEAIRTRTNGAKGTPRWTLPKTTQLDAEHTDKGSGTDVRELLYGLRPAMPPRETVTTSTTSIVVWEEVDVVVVGGGTSGACAAIGAARQGARVLVLEYQEGLGGVGTLGLIGHPYHGRNEGFTKEVPFPDKRRNVEDKMEWFRREIRDAGGEIWFGVLGCGTIVRGNRVCGVAVATSEGRGAILAKVVIDATGNADVAIAAGAEFQYGGNPDDIALQGTGLPLRPLGAAYVNTDYLLVDEADAMDTWRALVGARQAADPSKYDIGTFIQNRERRRIVGDHVLSYLDQIGGRTYPDSIVLSGSDYDSHGYPSEVYFALIPHTEKTLKANHPAPGGTCYTPYRCLLPRGLEGILVTGLGISMHRDASAMVRMQKDMHNQGYAAGVAAAMCVRGGCTPRQLDIKSLQEHLVEIGNLPASVLTDIDSFPLSDVAVRQAVDELSDPDLPRDRVCRALALVLAHAEQARVHLQAAHEQAEGTIRLNFAKILGVLGDAGVTPELVNALDSMTTWDEKILQGKMAEFAHLPTPTDAFVLALGGTGDARAVPAVLKKLETLDARTTLSHHRAIALALEKLRDPRAAKPLADLLAKPGMRGHAMWKLEPLVDKPSTQRRREGPLREIVIARALYRCGDHQGLGESILREYLRDIRGLFSRHAQAVLRQEVPLEN